MPAGDVVLPLPSAEAAFEPLLCPAWDITLERVPGQPWKTGEVFESSACFAAFAARTAASS